MPPLLDHIEYESGSKSPLQSPYSLHGHRSANSVAQDKAKYRTPPLLSSSIRARSSPKLIHGNSPLLQSWDDYSDEGESSNGRYDDADDDETQNSPSSRLLQEQLRNAVRAVQELQEAVEKQRSKRNSISGGMMRQLSLHESVPQQGMAELFRKRELKADCIGYPKGDLPRPQERSAIGLGLNVFDGQILKRTLSSVELLTSTIQVNDSPVTTLQSSKRNLNLKDNIACNSTFSAATPSKTWTLATASSHTLTPSHTYSPLAASTAPSTPTLEASNSIATSATPVMTSMSNFDPNPLATETTNANKKGDNSKSSSAYEYSTHHVSNTLIAGASVTAAGALLLLAAVLWILFKQRRRRLQHRNKMDAVLDKVSSHTSADMKKGDDSADNFAEKGEVNHIEVMAISAQSTTGDNRLKRDIKAQSSPNIAQSPPQELQMISHWLHYDMPGHPFATPSSPQSDRYSPDLAHAGIVGHETSKDQSFTWDFPKLSVPPAAARAMGTSHYVKKRMTLPRKSITSPRLSSSTFDAVLRPYPPSIPEGMSESASTGIDSNVQDIRTSTSSEIVDPEIDHLRRSFCLTKDEGGTKTSPAWITSAKRYFGSRQDASMSMSSSQRSNGHPPRRHSDASILDTSLACAEALNSLNKDLGLPSLSIANSSIVDAREATPFTSATLMRRSSKSKWTRSDRGMAAPRILSSESEDSHSYRDRIMTRPLSSRRMSHSEGHKMSTRQDVFEKALPRTPEGESEEPRETVMVLNRALHRFDWTSEMTDTEDESREGYEAEVEAETEYGSEMPHDPIDQKPSGEDISTPVITLTSSEEDGQFERRISLGSSTVHGSIQQHNSTSNEESKAESYANILDPTSSSDDDEDDLTIIYHSFSSKKDLAQQSDSINCLLSDDFPTIPEWVPINGAIRNIVS